MQNEDNIALWILIFLLGILVLLFFFGTTDMFLPKNTTTLGNSSTNKNIEILSLENSSKSTNPEIDKRTYDINQQNIQESIKEELNLTKSTQTINTPNVKNVSNPTQTAQEPDEYEQMMEEYYEYRENNPRVPSST